MNQNLEEQCAKKLRELRRRRGLTLHEFEALSNGSIKAVVLGSYERGTRAISLARLEQLSQLYEVSIEYFLGDDILHQSKGQSMNQSNEGVKREAHLIFDLRRIRKLESIAPSILPATRFLQMITRKRSDWNGEVLSLRNGDAETLALICELEVKDLVEELRLGGFLFASEVSGQRSL